MTEHRFTDTTTLVGTRITDDGYMVATVRCARTGCQQYLASDVGLDGNDVINVYRPETAVFAKDSLATFAHKPVTVGHPAEPVTADNWKEHAVGDVGDEIARDGEFVRVPITLMDAAAIKAVQSGLREISMGYTTGLSLEDGTAPDGTPYRAIQTGPIRINHLALVDRARGGDQLRVGDSAQDGGKDREQWGIAPTPITSDSKEATMPNDALKTVVLGDKAVQVAPADEAAIEAFKKDSAKALTDAQAAHDKAIADKDAEIAKKDAKIDELEKAKLSDADLDKRVQDRADLIGKARAIAKDVKVAGMSDADIRKAVVKAKLGDAAIADKSDAYIEARFDVLAEDAAGGDTFANVMKDGVKPNVTSLDSVYSERNQSLSSAWMGDAGKKEA